MEYTDNGARGVEIAYIGGGSRGWAWNLMSDLAVEERIGGTVRLYDIDKQAARDNEIIGNLFKGIPEAKGKWDYKAVDSIGEALSGAQFVVISILPGTFEEMRSDVHLPEEYGIWQPVGDTAGPAGIVRGLRTIPMYDEIALAIKKYAPGAWVINYTNPMTMCTQALYETFPAIKAFGCCHEVFSLQELMVEMLRDMCGIESVRREEIELNVQGLNHFTWIDRVYWRGMDLVPVYAQFVDKYHERGFQAAHEDPWDQSNFFASRNRVKFDLFRRYGKIACAGDRHLAEFVPFYLKDPQSVAQWMFGLTPVDYRIERRKKLVERAQRYIAGEDMLAIHESGEEGVRQICALLGLGSFVTNVNMPNRGQIPNMPLGAVVETNAYFMPDNVMPVMAGEMDTGILALTMPHVYNHRLVLDAARNCDFEGALRALIGDPLVALPEPQARQMLKRMLENTKDYLPASWKL